jgi:large subunit ribosomal protein L21
MDGYAVVETGGKQYMVRPGDLLEVEKLAGEVGASITLTSVLARSNGTELALGQPAVAGAAVQATVVKQFRADKVIAFRKKRRKGYKKKRGHRQSMTQIKIESIA